MGMVAQPVVSPPPPLLVSHASPLPHSRLSCYSVPLQVSNQCMALVRDDCLVPTLDAPELGYIRESTTEQYVPDVFYKVGTVIIYSLCITLHTHIHMQMKGEYGSEVTKLARPLPLEYLLIELTTTSPQHPKPYLVGGKEPPFPVENRAAQIQVGGASE